MPISQTACDSCCDRAFNRLYLNPTSALTCPLMENNVAARHRVYGSNWSYYTTLPELMAAPELWSLREDMYQHGYQYTCGQRNCTVRDMNCSDRPLSLAHPPAPYYFDFLAVSVDDFCRGNCIHCYQPKGASHIPVRVLEDLAQWSRARQVAMMGGEIFHIPEGTLDYYMDWAGQIGDGIVIVTAGDGDVGRYSHLFHKWNEVRVSVDALTRETHQLIRKGIKYDKVWRNLPYLAYVFGNRLSVMITAMGPNLLELPPLINKLASINVQRVRINPVFLGGKAKANLLVENNLDLWRQVRPMLEEQIADAEQDGMVIEWPGLMKVM